MYVQILQQALTRLHTEVTSVQQRYTRERTQNKPLKNNLIKVIK